MDYEVIRNGQPMGVSFPTAEEAWKYIDETDVPDGVYTVREAEG